MSWQKSIEVGDRDVMGVEVHEDSVEIVLHADHPDIVLLYSEVKEILEAMENS